MSNVSSCVTFFLNCDTCVLWLFLCEQKRKLGFDIYCNKMHMYCLKIAEKILCIANAQEILHYANIPICFIPQVSPFYIVEKVK